MHETLKALIELQSIDAERLETEKQLALYPDKLAALDERLRRAAAAIHALEEAGRQATLEQRKLERELASLDQRAKQYESQMLMVKSEKELHAVEHEVGRTRGQISGIEDALLQLMSQAEERETALAQAREQSARSEQEAATERTRIEEQIRRKQAQLELLRRDRDRFREQFDAKTLRDFDEVAERYPGKVVVAARGSACGGCYTELLPSTLVELNQSALMARCPRCGRYLHKETKAKSETE